MISTITTAVARRNRDRVRKDTIRMAARITIAARPRHNGTARRAEVIDSTARQEKRPASHSLAGRSIYRGAGRGSRTPTVSPPADFESAASANFAIPAGARKYSFRRGINAMNHRQPRMEQGARTDPGARRRGCAWEKPCSERRVHPRTTFAACCRARLRRDNSR